MAGIGFLALLALFAVKRGFPPLMIETVHVQSFKILFISLLLEAFPFILLGVLFSALLQAFVSDELIRRFTPKNPIAGVLFGGLLGILFPLCECGMIPVIRRLIRKGMPAYIGIVYLLAGPTVNPIVYTATFTAFRNNPDFVYSRMGLAFAVAVTIGLLFCKFLRFSPLKESHSRHREPASNREHVHNHKSCSHNHEHESSGKSLRGRTVSLLAHASDEFFEMGKYLIFGAFLTAVIQTGIGRSTLAEFADQPMLAYLFMMAFSFILSICSTSDAFIAASFSGMFHSGPLLAFLVFGSMIDFKNTIMLLSTFRVKIVLILIAMTVLLTLFGAWITEVLFL